MHATAGQLFLWLDGDREGAPEPGEDEQPLVPMEGEPSLFAPGSAVK
jgi:hypothetical protein